MILSLITAVALAGQWLPSTELEVTPLTPVTISQPAGSRVLFRFESVDDIEVWTMGRRLSLLAGPEETSIIPAAASPRELELRSTERVLVSNWRETTIGDAAAWSRFDRELANWVSKGGALPSAPRNIEYLRQQWEVRRELFEENDTLWAFMPVARVELESVRHAGQGDHTEITLGESELNEGESISISVGDEVGATNLGGFLEVAVRAQMGGREVQRFEVVASISGRTILREDFSTLEHEDIAGSGHIRRLIVPIPPSTDIIDLTINGAASTIETTLQSRLPTLSEFITRAHHRMATAEDHLVAMEWAHATNDTYGVVRSANQLLDSPFSSLANARLIEHAPSNGEALERFEDQSPTPIIVTALAQRWYRERDVDPALLTEFAGMLPRDPELLADLADSLPAGFFRPRGRAIRRGPAWGTGHDDHTRWSALTPENPVGTMHLNVERGGVERTLFIGGTTNRVRLPTLENGRVPKLRLQAETFTSYRIDDTPYAGVGDLSVALSPGLHTVEVDSGRLLLLDGELSIDGESFRTRQVAENGGSWLVPDTGAPCEIEVMVTNGPATLLISTNLGETWEVEAPDATSTFRFEASPWASRFSVDVLSGPDNDASGASVRLSAAIRRSIEATVPTVDTDLQLDPLVRLNRLSSLLYNDNPPEIDVALRLSRAIALGELGLSRSARLEAIDAVQQDGVSAALAQASMHIVHQTTPLAHSYGQVGPTTIAASAALLSEPPPTELDGIIALTERLSPTDAAPAHLELAEHYLAEGAIDLAWRHADLAGDAGRVMKLRAEGAGNWVHLPRVDRDSGSRTIQVGRSGPSFGASLLNLAHEAMLGLNWQPSEYVVLRGDRTAETIIGAGELLVEGVCADLDYDNTATSCDYEMQISGETHQISIPANSMSEWSFQIMDGDTPIKIQPSPTPQLDDTESSASTTSTSGADLAIRLTLSGGVISPRAEVRAHKLGERGVIANIAPNSLVRVRLIEGGPVTATLNDYEVQISSDAVLPVSGEGLQELLIRGPSRSMISLSRLDSRPIERALESATTQPQTIIPPDRSDSAAASIWLSNVSRLQELAPTIIGNGATYGATFGVGYEKSGVGDFRNDYPFQAITLSIAKRTDSYHLINSPIVSEMTRHWLGANLSTRRSELGHPSLIGDAYWVAESSEWLAEVVAEGGTSGGASHYSISGEFRLPKKINNYWTLTPALSTEFGQYTDRPLDAVDPQAWSPYDAAHHSGLGATLLLDWRGIRDNRLRLGTTAKSTPNMSPNWVESHIRLDSILFGQTTLSLVPAIGYRFQSDWRSEEYLRPRLAGALGSTFWLGGKRSRAHISAVAQWLPLLDVVEGRVELEFNWSDRRGLRDIPPTAGPFRSALDIEVESQ